MRVAHLVCVSVVVSACHVALTASPALAQADCPADMVVLVDAQPSLPAIGHNTYAGHAVVRFRLDAIGRVSDARLVSSEWKPVGSARGTVPRGYDDAILEVATKWRYPSGTGPCVGTRRFEIVWE